MMNSLTQTTAKLNAQTPNSARMTPVTPTTARIISHLTPNTAGNVGAAGVVLVAQPHVPLEDVDAALEVFDSDAAAAAVGSLTRKS